MKLYWSIGSQPARAVKTLLDIGGIPVQYHKIVVLKGEHRTPQFLKMYPFGLIPVLVDGDLSLGESSAIMSYLCQKYPHISHFEGRNIQERALVHQYVSWYQGTFRQALFRPFRKYLAHAYEDTVFYKEQRDVLIENMVSVINQFQSVMSGKGEKFVTGNTVTYADWLYYYELINLKYFGMGLIGHPWLEKWCLCIEEQEEVRAINEKWEAVALERTKQFASLELPSRG